MIATHLFNVYIGSLVLGSLIVFWHAKQTSNRDWFWLLIPFSLIQELLYAYLVHYPIIDASIHILSILIVGSALRHCYNATLTLVSLAIILLLSTAIKVSIHYQVLPNEAIYLIYLLLYILLCIGYLRKPLQLISNGKVMVVLYSLLTLLVPLVLFVAYLLLENTPWQHMNLMLYYIIHIGLVLGFSSLLLYQMFIKNKSYV